MVLQVHLYSILNKWFQSWPPKIISIAYCSYSPESEAKMRLYQIINDRPNDTLVTTGSWLYFIAIFLIKDRKS